MDTNIRDEVVKDFKESLDKIDFSSYNPQSQEFETALFTGLMAMIMNSLEEPSFEMVEGSDEIGDEIYGGKKYFQRYLDSKDEMFKKMAMDELDHASYLIKKAYNKPIGNEEKSKLKKYESDVEQVREQIKSY